MDKTIVTALLVIAGAISAITFFNAIYPTIGQSGDAISSMQGRIDEQLKSQIQIIYAAQSNGQVQVWVKNVGALRVAAPQASDVFFGPDGAFSRIPYGGNGTPHWEYTVEGGSSWDPSTTLRITIVGYAPLAPGRYYARVVLPNGVADQYLFSW